VISHNIVYVLDVILHGVVYAVSIIINYRLEHMEPSRTQRSVSAGGPGGCFDFGSSKGADIS